MYLTCSHSCILHVFPVTWDRRWILLSVCRSFHPYESIHLSLFCCLLTLWQLSGLSSRYATLLNHRFSLYKNKRICRRCQEQSCGKWLMVPIIQKFIGNILLGLWKLEGILSNFYLFYLGKICTS